MYVEAKLKIVDNRRSREVLGELFDNCDQVTIAKWAIALSKHIFEIAEIPYNGNEAINNGYIVNEKWQNGKARMFDVRQAGFSVHKLAKASTNPIEQTVFRVAGQAIGTGHMKEHGMVASDYAIKVINLKFPSNYSEIERERKWQIDMLKRYYDENESNNDEIQYAWMVIEDNSRLYIEKNKKSQTIMYLTKNQLVREIDSIVENDSYIDDGIDNWIKIETKTKKKGFCIKENLVRRNT